jgi:chromosome segregation ATPase
MLLYSIAQDNRELKDEMKKLREDFNRFNNALEQLSELVNGLRAETAFLQGKLNS